MVYLTGLVIPQVVSFPFVEIIYIRMCNDAHACAHICTVASENMVQELLINDLVCLNVFLMFYISNVLHGSFSSLQLIMHTVEGGELSSFVFQI